VNVGTTYRAGQAIAHGHVDTGDQVFVDKFTYNFRLPHRGDVFVFDTENINTQRRADMDQRIHSEYYIKRLAGIPGDTLRIDPPRLYINGKLATEPGFTRVMRAQDGYRGYSGKLSYDFQYLTTPTETFTVPAESYFALGDNSFNSSDSRVWGRVPAENVVGRGLLVYWPFTRHWGWIH
jgi:signal peptidase I